MALDDNDKEWIIQAIQVVTKKPFENLINQLNKNNTTVCRRFDDVDKRLEIIESRLKMVSSDTKIIPDIFKMLKEDGLDIARLRTRVDNVSKNA